jgi:FixJ family two-component response regulator
MILCLSADGVASAAFGDMSTRVLAPLYERIIAPFLARMYLSIMATNGNKKLVVIVDDDDLMRTALQGMLKAVGWPAQAFASAEEFLQSGQQHQTSCLITDIRMPGMSGLELQAQLNAEHCKIPTIFITAHGDAKMRMQALRAGAVEFLAKPFDDEALLESVRAALES